MKTRYEFCEGKYVFIRDDTTMQVEALRHGEPWPAMTQELIGSKVWHAALNFMDHQKAIIDERDETIDDYRQAQGRMTGELRELRARIDKQMERQTDNT
jgi:hypothetical protein